MKAATIIVYGDLDMDAIYRNRRTKVSNRVRIYSGKGMAPIYGKAMRQYGVCLDHETVRAARKLGCGLLAPGLREAVRMACRGRRK